MLKALLARWRELAPSFGEVLGFHEGKERAERYRRRMLVWLQVGRVEDMELLLKSNVTRYTKLLAESFARDLGGRASLDKDRIFLAGRIYETEVALKNIAKAKTFFEAKQDAS